MLSVNNVTIWPVIGLEETKGVAKEISVNGCAQKAHASKRMDKLQMSRKNIVPISLTEMKSKGTNAPMARWVKSEKKISFSASMRDAFQSQFVSRKSEFLRCGLHE